jgi:hypothetical protein
MNFLECTACDRPFRLTDEEMGLTGVQLVLEDLP